MKSLLRILTTARELWPYYLGIILSAVIAAATALLTPFIIASATERVIQLAQRGGGSARDVMGLALALLGVMIANSVVTNIGGYLGDQMATRLRRILSTRYFDKLLRLPQRYFDSELTGTVISLLNRSITSVTDFLQSFSNSFFTMLITVAAVLVISGIHSPWLALLLFLIYPTFVWLTALTSRRWRVWETAKNEHYDVAGGRFAEVIGQMRVVKSFTSEGAELQRFGEHYDEAVSLTRRQSRFWHWMDVVRRVVLDVVFFVLYLIIFASTARGSFGIATMVLLIQLIAMARQPVTNMSYLVDTAQRAVTGSREYFTVMDEPEEEHSDPSVAPDPTWTPTDPVVEFDGVDFGYDEDLVLHHVDLSIRRGERIAFVGESGGGKTTLVNLLMKLYSPTAGTVRVDGRSVTDVPTGLLRRRIGVVFQEASLFSGTIRDNIAYGRAGVDEEALREAARRANALVFIDRLPKGFDTEIGERGIKLSGGQKQRIAVARAMLKDAPILILDEATSSLDTKSERLVQAGLEELMQGRTTLIIAHRLSTIATVDRIVTIRDGVIDEIGTPAELATTGGIYAELLALQGSTSRADRARLRSFDITH